MNLNSTLDVTSPVNHIDPLAFTERSSSVMRGVLYGLSFEAIIAGLCVLLVAVVHP